MEIFASNEVKSEYERILQIAGEQDPYAGPNTLGIHDVLKAHFLIADFFFQLGEGLGGLGPKSVNLLHSALGRQLAGFGGKSKWTSNFEIAATLFFGLIMDHPFHDANKRTAFLSALYALQRMGRCPSVPEKRFEDFAVEVADRQLMKYDRYKNLLRTDPDPEVRYIAAFFQRNTREIDKNFYAITYRQLDTILRRYGFYLAYPKNNRIDVLMKQVRRSFPFLGKRIEVETRIGQVGFPGWTTQASQSTIQAVRKMTSLDYQHQVDSQEFFKGVEPLSQLIATYQGPLKRLAHR